jgi:hypothetical protein
MKLEQQVCSLELAKRLNELGVKQNFWNHSQVGHDWYLTYNIPSFNPEYYFRLHCH